MEGNEQETPAKELGDVTRVIRSDALYFEALYVTSL